MLEEAAAYHVESKEPSNKNKKNKKKKKKRKQIRFDIIIAIVLAVVVVVGAVFAISKLAGKSSSASKKSNVENPLEDDKYDEIMRLLVELKDYTQFHFADEEMLMEKMHYPELAAQKRAHTAFVERLVEIDFSELDDMDNNQQTYLLELIQFLLGWLSNHIIGMDKKIAVYMDEMKKSLKNLKETECYDVEKYTYSLLHQTRQLEYFYCQLVEEEVQTFMTTTSLDHLSNLPP
ncbi:MAG: hypothetical protein EGQ18_06250, partial [Eubacterium ventriosum]|nr:hypothetical protein [Eubacterium ventriosum]